MAGSEAEPRPHSSLTLVGRSFDVRAKIIQWVDFLLNWIRLRDFPANEMIYFCIIFFEIRFLKYFCLCIMWPLWRKITYELFKRTKLGTPRNYQREGSVCGVLVGDLHLPEGLNLQKQQQRITFWLLLPGSRPALASQRWSCWSKGEQFHWRCQGCAESGPLLCHDQSTCTASSPGFRVGVFWEIKFNYRWYLLWLALYSTPNNLDFQDKPTFISVVYGCGMDDISSLGHFPK